MGSWPSSTAGFDVGDPDAGEAVDAFSAAAGCCCCAAALLEAPRLLAAFNAYTHCAASALLEVCNSNVRSVVRTRKPALWLLLELLFVARAGGGKRSAPKMSSKRIGLEIFLLSFECE